MFQASQESIDRMKALYEERGESISDFEANQAVNNLCGYFKILNEWDMAKKAKEAAETESAIHLIHLCYLSCSSKENEL